MQGARFKLRPKEAEMSAPAGKWFPEIVYEEGSSHIPYIHVPPEEEDPKLLFIMLSRQTGEYEPGDDGEEIPIIEMNLHQYVDMSTLKARLSPGVFDVVRGVLGLLPLKEAQERGKMITGNVRSGVATITDADKRAEAIMEGVASRLRERGEA